MRDFTPGPWNVRTYDGSVANVDAEDGTPVAQAFQVYPISQQPKQEERKGNARLIASSPCMLAMLERIRDDQTFRTNDNSLWPDLLGLIAKARGEK